MNKPPPVGIFYNRMSASSHTRGHLEIAGIEFLEAMNGHLYTYDINTNTNYNSIAENLSDLRGMKTIADFLKKELEKLN